VTKLRCQKLKLIKKILSTEGHAAHIKTNVTLYKSSRCCFIPFIGWKFDASMHTSVRCIGEIIQPMNKTTQPCLRNNRKFLGQYSHKTVQYSIKDDVTTHLQENKM